MNDNNLLSLQSVNTKLRKNKATKIPDYIWKAQDLPIPKREWGFHKKRRWRFDFAYPEKKLAIEIEGGVFTFGRHNRPDGYKKDCEKYNSAIELGWLVLRYLPGKIDFSQILRIYESL